VIKGGGTDLLRAEGQQKKGESATGRKIEDIESAEQELARRDKQALKELKAKIEGVIAASPVLSQFRNHLLIDITTEGLRIQIVVHMNRPMFALAKAELQPYTKTILQKLGGPQELARIGVVRASGIESSGQPPSLTERWGGFGRLWTLLNLETWVRQRA
jgi:flagellar motor protein MotB